MHRIFLICFIIFSQNIWAQDTVVKYFVIDTIVFEKDYKTNTSELGSIIQGKFLPGEVDIDIAKNWIKDSRPQIFAKVSFTNNQAKTIGVTIDDKGSVVWFNNVEKLPDTIHIEEWTLFHNTLIDSVSTSKSYYHHLNDSTIKCYKHRESGYVTGTNVGRKEEISFILNNRFYTVALDTTTGGGFSVAIGHGFPRKRDRKKAYKEHKKFKPYNKFAISIITKRLIYKGELNL